MGYSLAGKVTIDCDPGQEGISLIYSVSYGSMYIYKKAIVDEIFHSINLNGIKTNNDLYISSSGQFVNMEKALDLNFKIYNFITIGKNIEVNRNIIIGGLFSYSRGNINKFELLLRGGEDVTYYTADEQREKGKRFRQFIGSDNFIFSLHSFFNKNNIHGGIKLLCGLDNYTMLTLLGYGTDILDTIGPKLFFYTFSVDLSIGYDWLDNDSLTLASNLYLRDMYFLIPEHAVAVSERGAITIKSNDSNYISLAPELRLLFKNKYLLDGKLVVNLYAKYNLALTDVRMNSDSDPDIAISKWSNKVLHFTNGDEIKKRMNNKLDKNSFEFGVNFGLLASKNVKVSVDYRGILFSEEKINYGIGLGINIAFE
ncbi:hypothetical protein FACS1894152_7190 [Bacilli bacterium]|nr:hypothetical protein FACS1894152_7190 [Bacilli bacterium]